MVGMVVLVPTVVVVNVVEFQRDTISNLSILQVH